MSNTAWMIQNSSTVKLHVGREMQGSFEVYHVEGAAQYAKGFPTRHFSLFTLLRERQNKVMTYTASVRYDELKKSKTFSSCTTMTAAGQ